MAGLGQRSEAATLAASAVRRAGCGARGTAALPSRTLPLCPPIGQEVGSKPARCRRRSLLGAWRPREESAAQATLRRRGCLSAAAATAGAPSALPFLLHLSLLFHLSLSLHSRPPFLSFVCFFSFPFLYSICSPSHRFQPICTQVRYLSLLLLLCRALCTSLSQVSLVQQKPQLGKGGGGGLHALATGQVDRAVWPPPGRSISLGLSTCHHRRRYWALEKEGATLLRTTLKCQGLLLPEVRM